MATGAVLAKATCQPATSDTSMAPTCTGVPSKESQSADSSSSLSITEAQSTTEPATDFNAITSATKGSNKFLKQDSGSSSNKPAAATLQDDFLSLWFKDTGQQPTMARDCHENADGACTTSPRFSSSRSSSIGGVKTGKSGTQSARSCSASSSRGRSSIQTPRLLRQIRRQVVKDDAERCKTNGPARDVFVLKAKRKMRSGAELDSSEIGCLNIGELVRIVNRATLPDGTQRAQVAKPGNAEPLGWVSQIGSNGDEDTFSVLHWMRFQRGREKSNQKQKVNQEERLAAVRQRARYTMARMESMMESSASEAKRPQLQQSTLLGYSSAIGSGLGGQRHSRPATRLPDHGAGIIPLSQGSFSHEPASPAAGMPRALQPTFESAASPAPTSVSDNRVGAASGNQANMSAGIGSADLGSFNSSNGSGGRARHDGTQGIGSSSSNGSGGGGVAAGGCSGSGGRLASEATGPADDASKARGDKLLQSTMLFAVAAEELKKAEDIEAQAGTKKELMVKVGEKLAERSAQNADKEKFIVDLMREWDPNRDGTITKMEFRQNLRAMLPDDKPDVKECDKLFDMLDADRSGEMDINELKMALKRFQEKATEFAEQAISVHANAGKYRERAVRAEKVALQTAESEQSVKDLETMSKKSVGAQLGGILIKKGLKVGDLVATWGTSTGQISKEDFRKHVTALGLQAPPTDVDELFDDLDDDLGGFLDQFEVRAALKRLAEESDSTKLQIKITNQRANDMLKMTKAMQVEWKQHRLEAEREEERERQRQAAEAQTRALAVEAAKAAKARAAEEKKAAAAAEKAAFEEKIELKRKTTQAKLQRRASSGALLGTISIADIGSTADTRIAADG